MSSPSTVGENATAPISCKKCDGKMREARVQADFRAYECGRCHFVLIVNDAAAEPIPRDLARDIRSHAQ
jgi:hypothetical protein